MDKNICGICADGLVYEVIRVDDEYKITVGEAFAKEMVNPLRTVDSTVGGMHRKHLHELLDEWIDNGLKEKNNG